MKIEIDTVRIASEKKKLLSKSQFFLDQQVLKDSNYYIPFDTGTLRDSGIAWTQGGVVEWNTEYAKKQYYGMIRKSKDKNPNASYKWFEKAKAEKLKEWEKIANDKYNQ